MNVRGSVNDVDVLYRVVTIVKEEVADILSPIIGISEKTSRKKNYVLVLFLQLHKRIGCVAVFSIAVHKW